MKQLIVIPAYGRDYKSKKEAEKDWNENKDFKIQDMSSKYDGAYVNKEDLLKEDSVYTHVEIRYKQLTQLTIVKI